jgi:hypothetical protein
MEAITRHPLCLTLALVLVALGFLATESCDTRRDIFDEYGTWVCLEIDWTEADLQPEGTSIYFYRTETGEYLGQLLTNDLQNGITRDSTRLRAGNYSIMVFNETENSHDYILFRNTQRYHAAEAYAKPLVFPEGSRYTQMLAEQPNSDHHTSMAAADRLAVALEEHLEVSPNSVHNQTPVRLRLTPQRLTVTVDLTLHLENIHSLYPSAQQVARISHMAEGMFLVSGRPGPTPLNNWFSFAAAQATSSEPKNGTLHSLFGSFGLLPEASGNNTIRVYFVLRNGTEYTEERDITQLLHSAPMTPDRHIVLEIGRNRTVDDPPIVLPDIPPGEGGSFDVDVGNWDDETNIDIPI